MIFIRSPLIPEFDATARNASIREAIFLIWKSFAFYFIIPIIVCLLVFKLAKFKKVWLVSLIFLTFFCYVYINSLHAVVDYSTYYTYGDIGISDILAYFKENNISAGEIATYAHLGSCLEEEEYWEITWKYNDENLFKQDIVNNQEIRYIVIYYRDIDRIGKNMDYFTLDKKIGTYYIYEKNEA